MALIEDTPIWLYDGVCELCSFAVRYTLRYEITPSVRFIAIQSKQGRKLATAYGIDSENPESFLFIENGCALSKSDGVLALGRRLRGPGRLIVLGQLIPRTIRDRLYDYLARNRYRFFGRTTKCETPDERFRGRFVLPD